MLPIQAEDLGRLRPFELHPKDSHQMGQLLKNWRKQGGYQVDPAVLLFPQSPVQMAALVVETSVECAERVLSKMRLLLVNSVAAESLLRAIVLQL